MKNRIHSGFTLALAVKEGHATALRSLLTKLNQQPSVLDFSKSRTTFFATGVILPAQEYFGKTLPETFILATTYWGPLKKHLYDIIQTNKTGIVEVLKHTEEFKNINLIRDKDLYNFLEHYSRHGAFNSRNNLITKEDMTNEEKLKNEIQEYIDIAQKHKVFDNLSARQIKELIVRHINSKGTDFEWAKKSTVKSIREFFNVKNILIIVTVSYVVAVLFIKTIIDISHNLNAEILHLLLILLRLLLILALVVVVTLIISLLILSICIAIKTRRRKLNNLSAERSEDSKIRLLASTQLNPVLNEMTATGPLKKGLLRKFFYNLILLYANEFVLGSNIQTVRSARWVAVNKQRQLVFLSNFANTSDFYIRDFLNGGTPAGIDFMFNNGQGFPDSSFIFRRGGIKKDPEGFMHAVHLGQQPADFWYAHEKKLTVDIISKNREIRKGLFKKMQNNDVEEWLKLF